MGHIPGVSDKYGSTIAGMSQPGSPAASAAAPPSGTSRIDPNQIPRPQPNASHVVFATRVNGQANLPPVLSHLWFTIYAFSNMTFLVYVFCRHFYWLLFPVNYKL